LFGWLFGSTPGSFWWWMVVCRHRLLNPECTAQDGDINLDTLQMQFLPIFASTVGLQPPMPTILSFPVFSCNPAVFSFIHSFIHSPHRVRIAGDDEARRLARQVHYDIRRFHLRRALGVCVCFVWSL
jgi:hypothetical protein